MTLVSDEHNELFASVDALLEQAAADPLPSPAARKRLREAAGLSQDQVANALNVRRETVTGWEAGRTEPRPPKRAAYARLLDGLATHFPAPSDTPAPQPPAPPATVPASPPPPRQPRTTTTPHRTATTPAPPNARFANGPLAVVDGDGSAYCADGLVLDCPLKEVLDCADSLRSTSSGRMIAESGLAVGERCDLDSPVTGLVDGRPGTSRRQSWRDC
ncbi:helix-turn-helix transcriptional regulator [Streptomyces sp. NPDC059697]|uniref:helix-turn-helix transcriptional regulator n=1 Tax=Streptomyces sp. NPDC059697 TaxID=3346912 RepID=UPI00368003E0